MSVKLTKQGVRDLSYIKEPPHRIRNLDELPSYLLGACTHHQSKRTRLVNGESKCVGCGQMWDIEGNEFRD